MVDFKDNYKNYFISIREETKLGKTKFASLLGISKDGIRRIEKGESDLPRSSVLKNLSLLLEQEQYITLRDIMFFNDRDRIISDQSLDVLSLYTAYSLKNDIIYFIETENQDLAYNTIAYEKTNQTRCNLNISYGDYLKKEKGHDIYDLLKHIIKIVEWYENVSDNDPRSGRFNQKNSFKSVNVVFDASNKKEVEHFNSMYLFSSSILKPKIQLVLFDKNFPEQTKTREITYIQKVR